MRILLQAIAWFILLSGMAFAQSDAVLRPGDVVAVDLPGEASLTGTFQVDQSGNLNMPEIGPVTVAGLTVPAAHQLVRQRLESAFRDVDRLRFKLLERRLPVKVLGNVAQPGLVDVPEGSSVQIAIRSAGGVLSGSNLARVQLRRDNQVTVFDYQRYLDSGNSSILPNLAPLDTIFVPAASEAIQVIGAVRSPGRFPWSRGLTLLEALALAGGPEPQADLSHLQLLSPSRGSAPPQTFDLAAFMRQGGDLGALPKPEAGSTVIVPGLSPDASHLRPSPEGSVFILGAVGKPGRYAFSPQLTLLDLIAAADGPTSDADLSALVLTRQGAAASEATPVNLRQFLDTGDGSLLPALHADDTIYVPIQNRNWLEQSKESTVRMLGAIARPGRYRFADDMTILDLLAEAGGPTSDALQQKIVIVNLSCCRDQARVFDLVAFARTGDFASLPVVRPGDTVYVPYLSQGNYEIFIGGVRDVFQILSTLLIVLTLGAAI